MIKIKNISILDSLGRNNQKAVGSLKEWGITELEKYSSGEKGECWKCPIKQCNFLFEDIICLKSHYLKEHNNRPYICKHPDCTWSFPTKSKLDRHSQAHEVKKWFACQFKDCNKSFKTTSNLKHHIKKVHESTKKFTCEFDNCSAVFHNQKGLECHRSTHEGAIPKYSCNLATCGKSFFTNNALSTHLRSHEKNSNDLLCKICSKQFDIPCRFKSHMLTHEITKPFQCQELDCTFSFLSQSKLNRHKETHSEIRKFTCSFEGCSKAFKRKEHLIDHERSVHFKKQKSRNISKPDLSPILNLESMKNVPKAGNPTNNLSISSSSAKSLEHSLCSGSARTSLAYQDIMQGKHAMRPNNKSLEVAHLSNMNNNPSHATSRSNIESMQDATISVEQDLMLSSANLPDSSSLCLQEELLSQEYFLLDSSNRLSDFEPSTINLRDLE